MSRVRALHALWALAILFLACCSCQEPPANSDAGDAAPRDAFTDTDALPDARPDAEVSPDVVQHGFCNEPFFKLPIDGQTDRTNSISLRGGRVAWTLRFASTNGTVNDNDVHLLDIETCIERVLTTGAQTGGVFLHADEVVWDNAEDDWQSWGSELYRYDLTGDLEERLTQTPQCELEPKSNGRYLADRRMETIYDPPALRLLDRQSAADIELSPAWTNIESFDMSDRFVVWVAYTQDPQSVGRDVFYHDLLAGETRHIDTTFPRYQYWTFLWEDWITWQGNDSHLSGPGHLSLYNLTTQEERSLVEGDYAVSAGFISAGLIAWNTSRYTGTELLNPSDIELYEISTTLSRRLTSAESNLRVSDIASPYLLLIHRLFLPDRFQNDYYVANLEELGVIDASGLLVPGAPVIDPP